MRIASFASLVTLVFAAFAFAIGASAATPEISPLDGAEPLQASCGNNRCEPPEDCQTCPRDCGGCCGNNRCEPPEDCQTCPRDCGSCCGNNRCEPPEDCQTCPRDCGACNR